METDEAGELCVKYFQPLSRNNEEGGQSRSFRPLNPATRSNPALLELIRQDFSFLPKQKNSALFPMAVGVHQISLAPRLDQPAVSSPNCLHRDGEPFTFVHLIARENVVGGVNFVACADCAGALPTSLEEAKILCQFTLENILDGFAVNDQLVSHYVGEVRAENGDEKAVRSVILIDFTPMVPQIV